MKTLASLLILLACSCSILRAQHKHATSDELQSPLQFRAVLSQQLSDPELTNYKMESSVLTIIPNGVDTVSHRHDCELFGYVLEGAVDIALTTKEPTTYHTGEMFYEKRNVLHTLTRNNSHDKTARVLLIFIIKDGRQGYTRAYPDKP